MTLKRDNPPFWRTKKLQDMSRAEWESLCDGCARCCLNKYEVEDTGVIEYTDVACARLDLKTCLCTAYATREKIEPDCITLTVDNLNEMICLPPTCAYRLVNEGKDLHWWHPLVSGSRATVHQAGISVRRRAVSERGLSEETIAKRIVRWPLTRRCGRRGLGRGL